MHVPDPPSDAGVFLYSLLCAFVLFLLGFSPSLGLLFDSLDSTFVSYVCDPLSRFYLDRERMGVGSFFCGLAPAN